MVAICQEIFGLVHKVVGKIWDFFDYSESTQCSLSVTYEWMAIEQRSIQQTFFRMYVFPEPKSFSTSLARSRDISSEAILAKVHNASPTAYRLEWFISL